MRGAREEFIEWHTAMKEAIMSFSKNKAHGDDLVPMSARDVKIKVRVCKCNRALRTEKQVRESLGLNTHFVSPDCVARCTNDYVEVLVKDVIAERLAVMMTLGLIPPYMLGMRIAALSKTKSMVVQ